MDSAGASGKVYGWKELISQVSRYEFDALALATPIDVPKEVALNYFKEAESLSHKHKIYQNLDAIYSPMASIYYRLNDNENFQKYFQKSVDNASQLGPPKLANYYVNIFKFFGSVGDLEKEYEFLLKGLEISEEYGYNIQKLMALMGLANFMIKKKYF